MIKAKTGEAVFELVKKVDNIQLNVESSKSETKLRDLKKNNVLIHKLPESESESLSKAFEEDAKNVLDLIDPKKELKSVDILDIRRIGSKESSTLPRSIIVKCNSTELRNKLLKLRNIKFSCNNKETEVYISPDRTKIEQLAHKKLVRELKDRKNKGEHDIMIRNGKIIKKQQPFRFRLQDFWSSHIQSNQETNTREEEEETEEAQENNE